MFESHTLSKRQLNGILLLDKPFGLTSNAALQQVKRLYRARKAGHTGSLDPLATGMLPICFGEATKFSQYLLNADKVYEVTARLGITTTTGDAQGDIIDSNPVPVISHQQLTEALQHFQGEIEQVPPMYSALKHKGKPLYALARQGIEVERKPRQITVYSSDFLDYDDEQVTFKVHCSKGTYIRSLVEDLGKHLGCGAHVSALRRLTVGSFQESAMITIDELEMPLSVDYKQLDNHLLPLNTAVAHWPKVHLSESVAVHIQNGQAIHIPMAPTSGWVALQDPNGYFIGIGEILEDGRVAPRRLVVREVQDKV